MGSDHLCSCGQDSCLVQEVAKQVRCAKKSVVLFLCLWRISCDILFQLKPSKNVAVAWGIIGKIGDKYCIGLHFSWDSRWKTMAHVPNTVTLTRFYPPPSDFTTTVEPSGCDIDNMAVKPKLFTIWSFREKVYWPLQVDMYTTWSFILWKFNIKRKYCV